MGLRQDPSYLGSVPCWPVSRTQEPADEAGSPRCWAKTQALDITRCRRHSYTCPFPPAGGAVGTPGCTFTEGLQPRKTRAGSLDLEPSFPRPLLSVPPLSLISAPTMLLSLPFPGIERRRETLAPVFYFPKHSLSPRCQPSLLACKTPPSVFPGNLYSGSLSAPETVIFSREGVCLMEPVCVHGFQGKNGGP